MKVQPEPERGGSSGIRIGGLEGWGCCPRALGPEDIDAEVKAAEMGERLLGREFVLVWFRRDDWVRPSLCTFIAFGI